MAFDPRLITEVIWRCPVCGEEESLHIHKKKMGMFRSKPVVICSHCKARWEELSENSMTLVEGEESLKGKRSIAEWATNLFTDELDLSLRTDVDTSVLLHSGEGIIKKVEAAVYPVGRLGAVRSTGRRYRLFANAFRLPPQNPLPKVEPIDYGEFVLSNHRIIFDGNRRVLNFELSKLVSVEVRNRFLELGHEDHKYAFRLGHESPFKWKTYIEAAFQALSEAPQEEKPKPRKQRARAVRAAGEKRKTRKETKPEVKEEPFRVQEGS